MSDKLYYVLAKFYVMNEGWLTLKANSPEDAKDLILKEFTDAEAIKDFTILDVRDTPPIMDEEQEQEEELKPEVIN